MIGPIAIVIFMSGIAWVVWDRISRPPGRIDAEKFAPHDQSAEREIVSEEQASADREITDAARQGGGMSEYIRAKIEARRRL